MATTNNKEVRFLNRDFFSFRTSLMNFAQVYSPTTYRDFNETSPGMMFIEMSAYVGDVLSFYIDKQFKEGLMFYAEETQNINNIGYQFGYRPKTTTPASDDIDVFQLIPFKGLGSSSAPDWDYAAKIRQGMVIRSATNSNVFFLTTDDVDFSKTGSVTTTVFSIDPNNNSPDYYLLKKSVPVVAGQLATETFAFGDPVKFQTLLLARTDITEIMSVTDSDGYTWYEVPYLAQDTIAVAVLNTLQFDPQLNVYKEETPYLMRLKRVPRRFEVRVRGDYKTELRFGSGISDGADEEIVPNTSLLSSTLPDGNVNFSQQIDPANFLFTKTYGQIPHNTTLTVQYMYGGGIETNVQQDNLTIIDQKIVDFPNNPPIANMVNQVISSIAVTNPKPASGGRGAETADEVRLNAMANFNAQNRAVTRDDYITRAISMPAKFGNIAKAFILPDTQLTTAPQTPIFIPDPNGGPGQWTSVPVGTRIANNLGMNLYVLGLDINGNLATLNDATKSNLKVFIDQYRMITDAINIMDAFIINIGVTFQIVALPKYNKNQVLLSAIQAVQQFFTIDQWQINQPIILADLITVISTVQGVQSIIGKPQITNNWKSSLGYSGNLYDIASATMNDVVYPSLDPSIFEVKFPDSDIKGQVVVY